MASTLPVYRFDSFIVRTPSSSVVNGLRADDRGNPTYAGVLAEHAAYIHAVSQAGVEVTVLPPLEAFPDSIFVEDPALVFPEGAILLRPGAPTRAGETAEIAPVLKRLFSTVLDLPRGFADGGDVLTTQKSVMIGLSARTNREGAEALIECLAKLGRKGEIVETPKDVLHFKTDQPLPAALAERARVTGRVVELPTQSPAEIEQSLAALRQAAVKVEDLEIRNADLEDVFINLMQDRPQQPAGGSV